MRGTRTLKSLKVSGMASLAIALAAALIAGCSNSQRVPSSVARSASSPGWAVGDNLGKSVFNNQYMVYDADNRSASRIEFDPSVADASNPN